MLKIKCALPYLRNCQSKTSSNVSRECLKWYSGGTKFHSGKSKLRTSILLTLGGGVAAGLAVSLLFPHNLIKDSILEEAGCREKEDEDKGTDDRRRSGSFGLEEAVKKSRDLLQRVKDEVGSPGIVAAVSVDGKLLWTEGLGYADVENRLPCTQDGIHRIASISKSFTMTAVAKLWEEGKLDLDKPVQFYVPEFPEKEVDGEQVDITTRQLVSHLTGIRHYSKNYIKKLKTLDKDNAMSQESKEQTRSNSKDNQKETSENEKRAQSEIEFYITKNYSSVVDALELFKDDPLMHKPGSKFYYTTHGWTLVSAIVDAAAEEDDFLTYMQKIFKDLGMFHTVPDETRPLIYNRARGYMYNKKRKLINTPAVNLSHKWAGGGFLSDVGDLIQFGNAMLYSYQYTEKHKDAGHLPGYLKPETVHAIWSSVPLTKCSWEADGFYAMGWGVREKSDHKGFCPEQHQLVSHTGGAVGASSVLLVVPMESNMVDKSKCIVNDRRQDDIVQDQTNKNEPEELFLKDVLSLPQGVVVAIIANLEDVGLYKTAVEIAKTFHKINC